MKPAACSLWLNHMRFLFLTTHYYPHVFGAELFAQKLAESLVAKNHQIDLITGEWHDSWPLQEVVNGVSIYRIRSPRVRYLQTLLYIQPQLSFAHHLVKEYHYDFIHAHIYPSLFNGWRLGEKSIVTIQGGDLGDYSEIYGPFGLFAQKVIGHQLTHYHTIHAVSNDLANKIKSMSQQQAIVIPNGVDLDPTTKPYHFSLPQAKYIFCSPSRLTDKNNLLETIKAIIEVKKTHDVALIIAGSGHLKTELHDLINRHHAESYIQLVESLPHEQLLQLVKDSYGVVRASIQEGFGIALLEGMALGKPVVATTNGGLADFISDQTAYVCSAKADSIAIAIKDAIADPSKSNIGYQLAQTYSWDKITDRCYHELYDL